VQRRRYNLGLTSGDPLTERRLIALSNDDCELMLKTAVDHFSAGRFEEATRLLRGLIALDAADARPYTLLGSILIFRDHFREAAEILERAVELAPADPYVLVNLAEVYLDGLRIDDALPLLERLFALDPNRESAAANRGRQILAAAHARLAEGG